MATSPSDPTPEEVAAAVAAVELLWPRAVVVEEEQEQKPPAWRFSGRWWARPVPVSRRRPWLG
jgi:hypothetical protein